MSDLINNSFPDFNSGNVNLSQGSISQQLIRSQSAGLDFQTMLEQQLKENEAAGTSAAGSIGSQTGVGSSNVIQFSKHAQQRVEQRGIELTDSLLNDLNSAVAKAREKGSKDMVVIDSQGAFIVNVPNNTVVTAVTGEEMKENIFTNIDSAVIL